MFSNYNRMESDINDRICQISKYVEIKWEPVGQWKTQLESRKYLKHNIPNLENLTNIIIFDFTEPEKGKQTEIIRMEYRF